MSALLNSGRSTLVKWRDFNGRFRPIAVIMAGIDRAASAAIYSVTPRVKPRKNKGGPSS
jgi:hypothetical protein